MRFQNESVYVLWSRLAVSFSLSGLTVCLRAQSYYLKSLWCQWNISWTMDCKKPLRSICDSHLAHNFAVHPWQMLIKNKRMLWHKKFHTKIVIRKRWKINEHTWAIVHLSCQISCQIAYVTNCWQVTSHHTKQHWHPLLKNYD